MSARTTRLVVVREIREAARRKGVWALIILTFLGASALVLAPGLLPSDDNNRVMVVGSDQLGIVEALRATEARELIVTTGLEARDASDAIADLRVDVAVLLGTEPSLLVEDETSDLVLIVREVVADRVVAARLAEAGIDPNQVIAAFVDAAPEVEPIEPGRRERESAALGVTLVLYILTVVLTSQVASAVAIEKSNRVSEVLLAIVPPRSMLFGKVIGVGCIGLTTLVAAAIPVVARLLWGSDLPADLGRTLLGSALWFVGGLALYLTLAGALGAVVARQEEAGAVVVPLATFLVSGYVVAITAADGPVGAVLAYVPLFSPMIEPFRIAIGAGSGLEYAASGALLFGSVIVAARLGEVVFRRAIVRTGRRLRLGDIVPARADRGSERAAR
jgi:ABC-2 type transport system permease protein